MKSIPELETQVLTYLEKCLNPMLVYHTPNHTKWVAQEVLKICSYERVDELTTRLIYIAALCHDAGYVEKLDNNEPYGAQYAEKLMLENGFDNEDIEFVKKLILESDPYVRCTSKESEILSDADLGYLGTSEFLEGSHKLYLEYINFGRISGDESEWLQKQIEFLHFHEYYTLFSKKYRLPVKERNLMKLQNRFEKLR
ncbi:MAG: HD domain-containing protein [Schleiferiaceae bacterium]|jgi:predicted metal-dependent HD superfamily phosphohydrolase|nr:HD domain-containing protein [Schleiferiaceae bacterium]